MGNRDRDLVVVAVVVVVVVMVVVVAGGMVPEKWLDGESVANWCQKRPGACRCQPCRLLGNTLPACLDLAGGELKFTLSMPSDRPASVTPCRLRWLMADICIGRAPPANVNDTWSHLVTCTQLPPAWWHAGLSEEEPLLGIESSVLHNSCFTAGVRVAVRWGAVGGAGFRCAVPAAADRWRQRPLPRLIGTRNRSKRMCGFHSGWNQLFLSSFLNVDGISSESRNPLHFRFFFLKDKWNPIKLSKIMRWINAWTNKLEEGEGKCRWSRFVGVNQEEKAHAIPIKKVKAGEL